LTAFLFFTAFLAFAVGLILGLTLGFAVGIGVGTTVGVAFGVGEVRVIGLIPAVIAYEGIENAVIDVMLQVATSEERAFASAESTVSEYLTLIAIQLETYVHLPSGGNHVLGS
jgi:hypothetical protein